MRAWIGCLACYNSGHSVGEWFDALTAGDVTVSQVHGGKDCPHDGEELWVMDSENLGLAEVSPAEIQEHALILSAHHNPKPLIAYWKNEGVKLSECVERFNEAYCGEHADGEAFAEQLAEDIGVLDREQAWPFNCIDWTRAWYALEAGGDYYSTPCPGGGVFIFRSV